MRGQELIQMNLSWVSLVVSLNELSTDQWRLKQSHVLDKRSCITTIIYVHNAFVVVTYRENSVEIPTYNLRVQGKPVTCSDFITQLYYYEHWD